MGSNPTWCSLRFGRSLAFGLEEVRGILSGESWARAVTRPRKTVGVGVGGEYARFRPGAPFEPRATTEDAIPNRRTLRRLRSLWAYRVGSGPVGPGEPFCGLLLRKMIVTPSPA